MGLPTPSQQQTENKNSCQLWARVCVKLEQVRKKRDGESEGRRADMGKYRGEGAREEKQGNKHGKYRGRGGSDRGKAGEQIWGSIEGGEGEEKRNGEGEGAREERDRGMEGGENREGR